MYQWIHDLLMGLGLKRHLPTITLVVMVVAVVVLCVFIRAILRFALVRIAKGLTKVEHKNWVELSIKNKLPQRLANLAIPIIIGAAAVGMPDALTLLEKTAGIAAVVVVLFLFNSLAGTFNDIYVQLEVSKTHPIKGFIQIIQVVLYIITFIIGIAIIMGQSPFALLGGIGAVAAVISFVFKDPILGFVAGIQLTSNDMVRIGDWIEMPKYSADGDVIEISMTTIKVRNFDNSVTSIPAYALVSDAFVNWRGMSESGGRRIKRAIYIDAGGIRLCDDAMIERFSGFELISGYMRDKLAEIARYNKEHEVTGTEAVNVRQLTNVGTLRAYMLAYLKKHPGINHNMAVMVRQLPPDERGLPLEVYAFANTTVWDGYEGIQSDIFDHFYSVIPEFGLEVYQKPSSGDVQRAAAGLGLGKPQ